MKPILEFKGSYVGDQVVLVTADRPSIRRDLCAMDDDTSSRSEAHASRDAAVLGAQEDVSEQIEKNQ